MHDFITTHDIGHLTVMIAAVLLSWMTVILSSVMDFFTGISTAKALGEPLLSGGFKRTTTKIRDYLSLLLLVLMFDILGSFFALYTLPFCSMFFAGAVVFIEGYSMRENIARKNGGKIDPIDVAEVAVKAAAKRVGVGGVASEIIEKLNSSSNDNAPNGV